MSYEQSNVGLGMVPCRANCRCPDCTIDRLQKDIKSLRAKNAELVELLKELQPIAFITRHNELHKAIDDAIARNESAEVEER